MIQLTAKQKQLLQWMGYPLLALVIFFGAAWASFPTERLKGKLIESADRAGIELKIAELRRGFFPGKFIATTVIIKTRPDEPGEKPAVLVIDELEIDFGVLALLTASMDVDALASLGGGELEAALSMSSDEMSVQIKTEQLPTAGLPGLGVVLAGLKLSGGLNLDVDLTVPQEAGKLDWSKMNGVLALSCPGCSVEGKVVPKMTDARSTRMSAFAAEGVTLPRLSLGNAGGRIVIEDGRGDIETFEAKSKDGELYLEGYIEFTPKFMASRVETCAKFKFSDELKKENGKVAGMEAGMERARRDDGYIGMRWHGTFERPQRIGSRACVPGERPGRSRTRGRNADRDRPSINTGPSSRRGLVPDMPDPPEPAEPSVPEPEPTHELPPGPVPGADPNGDSAQPVEPPPIPDPRTSGPPLSGPSDDVAIDPSGADEEEEVAEEQPTDEEPTTDEEEEAQPE